MTKNKFYTRENTKQLSVGGVLIGGGASISVQSMTNTQTKDIDSTAAQIKALEKAGCQIVRLGVPDMEAARAFRVLKKRTKLPLVADIHFDWRLAIEALENGADKLRINPGNIGSEENVQKVVLAAQKRSVPIRIGVNAGSLKSLHNGKKLDYAQKAQKLVDAAMEHIKILENLNFTDIAVSLKASDVLTTVEAYKLFASKRNYPLHLGITEAGSLMRGTVKSSVGLGILLSLGLGDTIRVSLTADPCQEVKVGYQILQSLGLSSCGIEIISCPTCSRCQVDLIKIVNVLETELEKLNIPPLIASNKKPLKIAVMGCVVNGPGEALDSDIGIAGGKDTGILFMNGKIAGNVAPGEWVKTLMQFVINWRKENG
ncbi:MAG: flavodoxin-dependent (E)-4-hydroxy-3-methylbut-2-enyl-diphosphate synthase [Endomicrobiales bacterium]|nr:flavodoxin-dependent (E)-4-hydroxy-3-methylbut-2-enyl-diphosphate synthase [Endomicrobiales bacterium]